METARFETGLSASVNGAKRDSYGLVIMCDVLSTCSLGVVFGFVSNQKFSDSIGGFENTASSALQDGVNYLNDTLNVREKEGRKGGREKKSRYHSFFFVLARSK